MTTPEPSTPSNMPAARPNPALRSALGLALLAPAVLCCALSLLLPTLQTFVLSVQDASLFGEPSLVGAENYARLAEDPLFRSALGFSLRLALVRVLAVVVGPLLLALALAALGRVARPLVRLFFTVPWALYLPALLAAAWLLALRVPGGLLAGDEPILSDPAGAPRWLGLIDALYVLAAAGALGVPAYVAALRGRPGGRGWALAAVALAAGALALASGLQTFALPFTLTRGGPANATTTLALAQYTAAFVQLRLGLAGAIASVTLLVVMALGLAVGLLAVLARLRLRHGPADEPVDGPIRQPVAGGLLALLLLLALVPWVLSVAVPAWMVPLALEQARTGAPSPEVPLGQALLNTLAPVLLGLLVQVPVAYLAALGISGLRPLGRHSEWLLLPFSPWLFVTAGPLGPARFTGLQQADQLNTWLALVPPLLLSVPLLFALALFFRGAAERWRAAQAAGQPALGAFVRTLILPSLPLALLGALLLLFAGVQELMWPLVVASQPELATAGVVLVGLIGQFGADPALLARTVLSYWLPLFALLFVALMVFQILYLGRLVVEAGEPDAESA